MKTSIRKRHLEIVHEKHPFPHISDLVNDKYGRYTDDSAIEVNLATFRNLEGGQEWIDSLYDTLHRVMAKDTVAKRAAQIIEAWRKLTTTFEGKNIDSLEEALPALISLFAKKPNRWLFIPAKDGLILPVVVTRIEFQPDVYEAVYEDGRGSKKRMQLTNAAHVTLTYAYYERGYTYTKEIYWYRQDVHKNTPVRYLLDSKNVFVESAVSVEEYEKDIAWFNEIEDKTGEQMSAKGYARSKHGRWGESQKRAMIRDGQPTRVLIDDKSDESKRENTGRTIESGRKNVYMSFWRDPLLGLDENDAVDDKPEFALAPVWPTLGIFDLDRHQFLEISSINLAYYPYDTSAFDKLVLPGEVKDLVDILVNSTGDLMEDIVEGKTGGVIVLATGDPGCGKTLTAEVYSQYAKMPLYNVQCSQLGLNITEVEKNLTTFLSRAMRWKAILLVDEADVYVRERGEDIHQNAIVGVFLRVLEYYRGILFMTSNRGTIIDDAILSRCTAHIRYAMPGVERLPEVWRVLSTQLLGAPLDDRMIAQAVEEFPQISGRDVKGMLKLSRFITKKEGGDIDADMIRRVSKFKDLHREATKDQAHKAKVDPMLRRINKSLGIEDDDEGEAGETTSV